jgi:DNA-binding Lrp family transcriptional regulator
MAAPDLQVEEIAAVIGEEPGVNHLYLRENAWNLWFVVTGPNRDYVSQTLARIERRTGLRVLDLELVRSYHIDLGFPLDNQGSKHRDPIERQARSATFRLEEGDPRLVQALTNGLPLKPRPFHVIATALRRTEAGVIARLEQLLSAGVIRRLGVIVRHRALGWQSNAMVVWDVSPDGIDRAGATFAAIPGVNLCYQRTRFEGDWPYNLYCLVHAKARADALKIIALASQAARLTDCPRQILFSSRCFKQTGAMLTAPKEAAG